MKYKKVDQETIQSRPFTPSCCGPRLVLGCGAGVVVGGGVGVVVVGCSCGCVCVCIVLKRSSCSLPCGDCAVDVDDEGCCGGDCGSMGTGGCGCCGVVLNRSNCGRDDEVGSPGGGDVDGGCCRCGTTSFACLFSPATSRDAGEMA